MSHRPAMTDDSTLLAAVIHAEQVRAERARQHDELHHARLARMDKRIDRCPFDGSWRFDGACTVPHERVDVAVLDGLSTGPSRVA